MQLVRKKVLNYIQGHELLSPGDKVIVAVSGGGDSIALLDILANLQGVPLRLVVAHFNHSLRGDESDGDELFVREVAAGYNLPCEIIRVDIKEVATAQGLSLEEAGRNARRAFLMALAEKYSAEAVALGHHRDDQAETVLMRLIRGAAASGLTGMRPKSPEGLFVRPILCLSREEISGYLHKGGMHFRVDSSNSDERFLRNRIRHELLPLLKSYNPAITERLNRTAEALAADEDLLELIVDAASIRAISSASDHQIIDLCMVKGEPKALRKRIYRQAIAGLKGDLRRVSSRHLEAIDRLATGRKGGGTVVLPCSMSVAREYNSLFFRHEVSEKAPLLEGVTVEQCGCYSLSNGATVSVEPVHGVMEDFRSPGKDMLFVDAEKFPFPWTVRSFREGDRFIPFGMKGGKKLKDFFIDRKIPAAKRRGVPLFFCGGEIFWVGGVQAAENSRVNGVAERVLCVMIRHNVLS